MYLGDLIINILSQLFYYNNNAIFLFLRDKKINKSFDLLLILTYTSCLDINMPPDKTRPRDYGSLKINSGNQGALSVTGLEKSTKMAGQTKKAPQIIASFAGKIF